MNTLLFFNCFKLPSPTYSWEKILEFLEILFQMNNFLKSNRSPEFKILKCYRSYLIFPWLVLWTKIPHCENRNWWCHVYEFHYIVVTVKRKVLFFSCSSLNETHIISHSCLKQICSMPDCYSSKNLVGLLGASSLIWQITKSYDVSKLK